MEEGSSLLCSKGGFGGQYAGIVGDCLYHVFVRVTDLLRTVLFPSSYVSRIMFRVIPLQQVCLDQGRPMSAYRHQILREELHRWLPVIRLSLSNAVQCCHQLSPRHHCGYRRLYERQRMPMTRSLMASVSHRLVRQLRDHLYWPKLRVFHARSPRPIV